LTVDEQDGDTVGRPELGDLEAPSAIEGDRRVFTW
jgi:hypothetical protein